MKDAALNVRATLLRAKQSMTWCEGRGSERQTRIEIVSEVTEAASVPWELLRDPKTDMPLALSANAFVRAAHRSALAPRVPGNAGPVRILLVICRPGGDRDVPFRSVASRLIKALHGKARGVLQLDVLRRRLPYKLIWRNGHP